MKNTNSKSLLKLTLLLVGILVLTTSCMSTTTIRSTPSGAKVYVNDEYVGDTPLEYGDKSISFTSTHVRLYKDGYSDFYTVLTKDQEVHFGAAVCGCLTLPIGLPVGWLWALGYKNMYNFELQPAE